MSIEVIAVGTEILRGMIVNTNGAYLGRRLDEEGWNVVRQTTLPDDPEGLKQGLKEALDRSEIVITTGGIGPTLDDITPACAQTLFSAPGSPLNNRIGSAPGVYFKEGRRQLFLLPGIPPEMISIFEEEVLPLLPPQKKMERVKLHFSMLRENDVDPILRQLPLEAGIYPSYGSLTVVLRGVDPTELQKGKEKLQSAFQDHYYESPSGKLEEAIQEWMIRQQKTLACAESCTGGMIASVLTQIPDCSKYFLGSVVTYSNQLKEKLVSVSPQTLQSKGAVSLETVHEMWKGVLKLTGADFGVAVSGIAGPSGGTPEKPVGTVCYAIGFKEKEPEIGEFHFKGDRALVIHRTTRKILSLIWKLIK